MTNTNFFERFVSNRIKNRITNLRDFFNEPMSIFERASVNKYYQFYQKYFSRKQTLSIEKNSVFVDHNTYMDISHKQIQTTQIDTNLPTSRQKKPKGSGGYPTRSILLNNEVKLLKNSLKLLRDHSLGPNYLISINPPLIEGEIDRDRKRRITREINYIGIIFQRHKTSWYGITVFEKPKGGLLHAHHAVYIPTVILPKIRDWITKKGIWQSKITKPRFNTAYHTCPYNAVRHDSYITKEAQYPCDPKDWIPLPANRFRPRSGEYFRGKRWCITRAARRLS